MKLSTSNVAGVIDNYPELPYWLAKMFSCKKAIAVMPSGVAGIITVAARRHGDEVMDKFTHCLSTGEGLIEGSPIMALRDRFISHRTGKASRLTEEEIHAITIKAINAYTQGRRMQLLRFGSNEAFPELV